MPYTKEHTIEYGSYTVVEEFLTERSTADALFQYYARQLKQAEQAKH